MGETNNLVLAGLQKILADPLLKLGDTRFTFTTLAKIFFRLLLVLVVNGLWAGSSCTGCSSAPASMLPSNRASAKLPDMFSSRAVFSSHWK